MSSNAVDWSPAHTANGKRSFLSTDKLERRRKIERDAQRAARARTKSRIDELENKIESLLSGQDNDCLSTLMQQLDEKQAENRKLRASLASIQKILNATAESDPIGSAKEEEEKSTEQPVVSVPARSRPVTPFGAADNHRIQLGEALSRKHGEDPKWKIVNEALEAAIGSMTQTTAPLHAAQSDVDVSIRAIMEGWADVERIHNLDPGWKLLQQVDQYLFFSCGPVTRLAILRLMRLRLLVR
jgi:TolA-binding protein